MDHKKLAGVSAAIAAAAAGSQGAIAADAAPATEANPLHISLTGGLVSGDFAAEKLVYSDVLKTENSIGGYGAITVSRAFEAGSSYDWRLSGAITEFLSNDRSASYLAGGYYSSYMQGISASDDADWQSFDFDLGRNFTTDHATARLFAGVRTMAAQQNITQGTEKVDFDDRIAYGFEASNKFLGAGPRIGIEGRVGGMVGVEFAASTAAIYGHKDIKFSIPFEYDVGGYAFSGDIVSVEENDWGWAQSTEVSAGVSIVPSESTAFALGVRAEKISDIDNGGNDITAAGPYLKLNVTF